MKRGRQGPWVIVWTVLLCTVLVVASCGLSSLAITQLMASPGTALFRSRGQILWSADHETGNLSQWYADEGGGVFNTGTGEAAISDVVAHSGRYAIAMTISDADRQVQAVRVFRWGENPMEAYYSAWYFFPQRFEPAQWWNVFQFKSPDAGGTSQSMWSLNVGNLENGEMILYLWDALNQQTHANEMIVGTIPVGQWVHIEAFYRRATDRSGRIAIWKDSTKLYDLDGVQTAASDEVQWSLANYTDQITPSTVTIYADDAAISTTRIGPRGYNGSSR